MVFLSAIASTTIPWSCSYRTLPARFLELVYSGGSYHTPKQHSNLGESSPGSQNRRIQGKGGRMAQWCNPNRVRLLSVIPWIGSVDYVTSERNPMTTWVRLGRTSGGRPSARFMNICPERFLSCKCLYQRAGSSRLNPSRYSALSVTKVNTWGLVYVWKGRNDSLKPLLLTAHQGLYPTLHRDLYLDSRPACKMLSR